jgi:nicotinamide-nucleotide amidase
MNGNHVQCASIVASTKTSIASCRPIPISARFVDMMMGAVPCDDRNITRLAARLGRKLMDSSLQLTVAESCTGGWIAKALTDVPGSSHWFGEGFVTYSNDAKMRRLGVPRSVLESGGAVSEETARAMAEGALERSGADLAVAVTGIAGPDGGVPGKPVGTVWFCWAKKRRGRMCSRVERKRFRGDREAVRRKTVRWALMRLLASR